MRRRLVVVFLVPLVGVLLVLGGAYAWSAARSIQQEHIAELLGDVAYFVTSARQALRSGSPDLVTNEAERYFQLYGTQVLVVDRSGLHISSLGMAAFDYSLDEITGASVREVDPFGDFGGWGLRVKGRGNYAVATAKGPAVFVTFANGERLTVTTPNADRIAGALNTLASQR